MIFRSLARGKVRFIAKNVENAEHKLHKIYFTHSSISTSSASKSRYYKEENVQSKKRQAIRRDSSAFVMGAMFLASALKRGIFPPY